MKTTLPRRELFPLPPGIGTKVSDAVATLPSNATSAQIHAVTERIMGEIDSLVVAHYIKIYEMIVAGLKSRDHVVSLPRNRFYSSVAASAQAMARLEEDAPVFETSAQTESSQQTAPPPPTQLRDGQLAFGGF